MDLEEYVMAKDKIQIVHLQMIKEREVRVCVQNPNCR